VQSLAEPPLQIYFQRVVGTLSFALQALRYKLVSKTKSVFRSNPSEDLIERLR
jgi:hypothetical protein